MKMFTNKDIRRFFGKVLSILILLLLSGLILSQVIVQDFKVQMLAHDYEVAGYLLQHGVSPSCVSDAFTDEKSEQEIFLGKSFLQKQGYKANINNQLLPNADMLLLKYRLTFILLVVVSGMLILTAFFLYFKRQQNAVKKADAAINMFMGGDISARIDSDREGSLFRLFSSINAMAASLSSHVEAEKNTKEFLKKTIADISHQLKTPLTALKMYNEIIQEESKNEATVKKFTVKTEEAIERMEILIQNLLKITKLDAGTITLNKKEVNVRVFIEKIISGYETRADQEQKIVKIKGPADTTLYWDGDWMAEAIGNIVKNALDHMEAGGRVEIEWSETPVIIQIKIKDNGAGIHPEDIHHIFKRFYRSRFSQDTQGIGLGLSLAKSIIEAHNGTVSVDSSLGQGSIFTLDFLKLTNL